MLCEEDERVTSFEESFDSPVNGGPIKMIICITFDDTKVPEGL